MPYAMAPFVGLAAGALNLILLVIGVLIAVWVYQDAQRRYPRGSLAPLLWVLIVVVTGILGLIVYLLVRPREQQERRQW